MLEKETVLDLLGVVESDTVDVPALPLLQSIVQFGVPAPARDELGSRIADLLDVPPGTPDRPEYLQALAGLSTDDAAERLRSVATDLLDPDSFTAARLLSGAGGLDVVATHLPHLARIAEQPGETSALRALASLPLERYDVPASTFAASLASASIEDRLWAAIAVAKLGDHGPLRRVLHDLAEDEPLWMRGNPWTPYDALSEARPVPESVRAVLLDLDDDRLERNQRILIWALTGARSATGLEIEPEGGPSTRERPFPPVAPMTPGEADVMLRTVEVAARSQDASLLNEVDIHRAPLLPDVQRAQLVTQLVETCIVQKDAWGAIHWGNAAMDAIGATPRLDLPVGRIVDAYVHHDSPGMSAQQLGAVLARADDDGVARVIADGIRSVPSAAGRLAALLEEASRGTVVYLGAGGGGAVGGGFAYPAPPPAAPPPTPAPAAPPMPAPRPASPVAPAPVPPAYEPHHGYGAPAPMSPPRRHRLRWPRFRLPGRGPAGGTGGGGPAAPPPVQADPPAQASPMVGAEPLPLDAGPPAEVTYTAYPRIGVENSVVLYDEPFDVTIGLTAKPAPGVAFAGPIVITERFPIEDLEMELVVDPASLEVVGGERVFKLPVTSLDDFPTHVVTLRARYDAQLQPERQIALVFRRAGRPVGFAFRRIVAVETEADRQRSAGPRPVDPALLDLSPLVGDEPPDLLLYLFEGDGADAYVWAAYPREGPAPDLARSGGVLDGRADFASFTRRAANAADVRGEDAFLTLTGLGRYVADAMPAGVTAAVRQVVAASPDTAPSILLLTQEPFVPWELAVLDPPLHTSYGQDSPFLGAHAAISRWPLDQRQRRQVPALAVRRQAAITAQYAGVKRWKPLEYAEAEVAELVRDYGMTAVTGSPDQVKACLEGAPAYDVIHIGLHGQFDHGGQEDGLVLVEVDANGAATARFLTTTVVRGLRLSAGTPFVFLNACQVGSGESVLGTYGGFAAALALSGASAVVAPLWNVDDKVAAAITSGFYAAAYGDPPVAVAEVVRRVRAGYNRERARSDPESCTPTLVSYQCFGHPRFTLRRTPEETP